jgi:hypothetical protein
MWLIIPLPAVMASLNALAGSALNLAKALLLKQTMPQEQGAI